MNSPKLGEIWEWTVQKWDDRIANYRDAQSIVLILSPPVKKREALDTWTWVFDALELDGDESGVVQDWYMGEENLDCWRKLV